MQNYDSQKSRNTSSTVPGQVSVKMPGMPGKTHSPGKPGSKVKSPAGFGGGVIPGKI
jgi:hypothetical protein